MLFAAKLEAIFKKEFSYETHVFIKVVMTLTFNGLHFLIPCYRVWNMWHTLIYGPIKGL